MSAEVQHCRRCLAFPSQGLGSAMVVDVDEQQVLYLPAGWWHEVTSGGGDAGAGVPARHAALNYWFHPPDNLDPKRGFLKPYTYGCREGQRIGWFEKGGVGAWRPPPPDTCRQPSRQARGCAGQGPAPLRKGAWSLLTCRSGLAQKRLPLPVHVPPLLL